jgi:predicted aldo/keto reductase-like oxidoreductase
VDHVDLTQLHNLIDETEWETALPPCGALDTAAEARADGLVRFIGVTGHGLAVARQHRRALERFPFDAVLLTHNYLLMKSELYASEFEDLVAVCHERGVAVQTIKALARGPGPSEERWARTWYEPLSGQADVDLAVHWVLGRPDTFLNTVGDRSLLPKLLEAAERFRERPTNEEMEQLLERAEVEPLFVDDHVM